MVASDGRSSVIPPVAAWHGWQVIGIFEDAGISGAKGRDQRPGLDAMMMAVVRRERNGALRYLQHVASPEYLVIRLPNSIHSSRHVSSRHVASLTLTRPRCLAGFCLVSILALQEICGSARPLPSG